MKENTRHSKHERSCGRPIYRVPLHLTNLPLHLSLPSSITLFEAFQTMFFVSAPSPFQSSLRFFLSYHLIIVFTRSSLHPFISNIPLSSFFFPWSSIPRTSPSPPPGSFPSCWLAVSFLARSTVVFILLRPNAALFFRPECFFFL